MVLYRWPDYTDNLFLPLALLAEITFLPFFVFILVLKPCVLFLGVLCGWYVLFILLILIQFCPRLCRPLFGRDFTLKTLKDKPAEQLYVQFNVLKTISPCFPACFA